MLTQKKLVFYSFLALILGFTKPLLAQKKVITISSFEELTNLIDRENLSLKNAGEQEILSRQQTIAAKLNALNFKPITNFSLTDNVKLNVLFLPGEAFGGPPGSFKQITTGQQYISNFNITPQLDLINPQAMAKIKVSKSYEQVTKANNQLAKKNLYENLAAIYYSALSLQKQVLITKLHLSNMDSLENILKAKFNEGISRQQELNTFEINHLTVANKLAQLEIMWQQQLYTLYLWCDLSGSTELKLNENQIQFPLETNLVTAENKINTRQKEALINYYHSDLRASQWGNLPTLTLFGSYAWQQNTNNRFLDQNKWINSAYIGLRVSVPLVDFTKMANAQYLKISLKIAENDRSHAVLQDSLSNQQLSLEYKKTMGDHQTNLKIEQLRKENYIKALSLYGEGIMNQKDLLEVSNELLISKLNVLNSKASLSLAYSKIIINQQIK